MAANTERQILQGPAGDMEVVLDVPEGAVHGFAFVGHPHPLYGGTLDNKVVATLARTFVGLGWLAVRLNFRGVGASAGTYDEGKGETQDFLHLIDTIAHAPPWEGLAPHPAPVALAGFSFGSFVAANAAQELARRGRAARALVLVGAAAGKWPMPEVDPGAIVIHGEVDETIPLADVFTWARHSEVPVTVIPGADHFFHRRLGIIKQIVLRNLSFVLQSGENMQAAPVGED
jgi:alpha/beta superfamily hydrolase